VMGGIGTLVGRSSAPPFFQLMRELLSRFLGDQFPYLIPLGIIFIAIIISCRKACLASRGDGLIANRHFQEDVLPRNAVRAATSFLSLSKSSAIRS